MTEDRGWTEIYEGGSPEAEEAIFLSLAQGMQQVQEANRRRMGTPRASRTLHSKMVAGVTNAFITVDRALPPDFVVAHFQPGASLDAAVRFSNASGVPQPDGAPDMRGAAIRIGLADGGIHDLLMTSFPVSHARDARQFVTFAMIAAGDRETLFPRLIEAFGPEEAQRMGTNIRQGVRLCASFALESFWSRGAILWGGHPVRFQLRPACAPNIPHSEDVATDADALTGELAARLAQTPVRYRLALQRFVDETLTPIEDGSIEWTEQASPPIEIATLVIPMQDLHGPEGKARAGQVEQMAFNPFNAPAEFRPLGNLNRARRLVYARSAAGWVTPAAPA